MAASPEEWVASVRAADKSARFVRCALQVNPFAYLERHGKATTFADETSYNAALVDACRKHDIGAIGVTDHFEIASSTGLIAAAEDADIAAFPGFEAVSSDGVHLLVLFDRGTKARFIERCIGECGIRDRDEPSPIADHDALWLLTKAARDWNAATIAAHVAGEGGLLKQLSGKARIRAWTSPDLLAVALPGPVGDAPQHLRAIVRNRDSNYVRDRPPAVVNAKDVCGPADLGSPSHSCWLKMSEISLRALRMAFLDSESRVRLASDPPYGEHARIEAVRWQGGFLDGLSLSLSEDLSVLIGGPGAGKSTVIESLRFALDIPPTGKDAKADHEGIVRHVLRSGTTVSVLVHYPHPSPADYVVERTVPNPPVVRDANTGEALELRLEDLMPRPEIYGQHEIAEIAADSQRRTRLLERFRTVDPARAQRLDELADQLRESRDGILKLDKRLARTEERLAALPGIEATLRRYREAGVEERLKDQSRLVVEEQLFADAREQVDALAERIEAVREAIPLDELPKPDATQDGKRAVGLARDLGAVLKELETASAKPLDTLESAVTRAHDAVDQLESGWEARKQEVEKKIGAALRKLQRDHIDGQEFITLRREIEKLRPLRQECDNLTGQRKRLVEARRKLLVERESLLAAELRDLERAAKAVTKRLGTRVRVTVEPEADRTPLFELISNATSGRMKETLDALRDTDQLSARELAERIRSGADRLTEQYGTSSSQAARLAAIGEESVMEIEELVLPTATTIELNLMRGGDSPRWQRLEHLSKGQKATAILLLVLLESEGPLIVDQPEDDLDNTFISDDVVPTIRREKPRRQFIFSTHNANIPVLADAELIVGLSATGEAAGGHAEVLDGHIGSIDVESVRSLVEERLEGGHDAFELRRQKYGI